MSEATKTKPAPKPAKAAVPAAAPKPKGTVTEVSDLVLKYARRLVGDARAQQFYAQVFLMAREQPKLATATPASLLAACMACVHLDLMPNTPEQYAAIIPYNNRKLGIVQAQFQIMYKGLVELAYRTGQVDAVHAELVFDGDEFEWALGLDRKLVHIPSPDIDRTDYGKVKAAYTTVELANGTKVFDVMTRNELDKVRKSAKAKATDAPWAVWPEAMAKKTVVKRIHKLLPKSAKDKRLELATLYDSLAEAGKLAVGAKGQITAAKTQAEPNKADEAQVKAQAKSILANVDKNDAVEVADPHQPAKPAKAKKSEQQAVADTAPDDVGDGR